MLRAAPPAVREADRAGGELAAQGVHNQRLIVNGVLEHPLVGDPTAVGFADQQRQAIDQLPPHLAELPVDTVALVPYDLTGLASLRALTGHGPAPEPPTAAATMTVEIPGIDALVAELTEAGPGVMLVMGKGGVGKTTVAAADEAEGHCAVEGASPRQRGDGTAAGVGEQAVVHAFFRHGAGADQPVLGLEIHAQAGRHVVRDLGRNADAQVDEHAVAQFERNASGDDGLRFHGVSPGQ